MNCRVFLQVLTAILVSVPTSFAWAQQTENARRVSPGQPPDVKAERHDGAAPPGHLEVPRDRRIVVPPEGRRTSPARRWSRDGYTSVQVNVDADGRNIVGDAANEPAIAVDPTDPNRMVIGWRQFDTIQSDFRQAGWGYTTDGGQTWTFPGVIEPGVFRSDPVVDVDTQGNFYFNSLTYNGSQFWCHVFKSTDGGQTWQDGVYAFGGDKQWMTIDRTNGIGRDSIYAYWTRDWSICYPGHFTRSYDGGQTFLDCSEVAGSPYWGTMAVGPDGELYVAGDGFVVAKSSTVQDETLPVMWDFWTTASLGGSMSGFAGPNPDGLLGQACIAVDHSDGPTRGNVYLLCSVDRPGGDPLDVMLACSTDGGHTWSAPVRINDDPLDNGAWQWFGAMSVAPNGRLDVIWNDTRNDPGGYDSELFYSYSEDAGQSWSANVALSPPFDPHVGFPQQRKLGDYYDMVSEEAGAHVAYAATFNGEQDVYYLFTRRLLSIGFPNGLPDMVPPGVPTDISVRITEGEEELVPGSAMVYYRYYGGDFESSPLVPLGGELYQATLPSAHCDATPEYYFSAEGTESGVIYRPPDAPNTTYTLDVGEVVQIFADDFETDQGWTVENEDLTAGAWERAVPSGSGGNRGDPPSDHDGSGHCYVTGNDYDEDVDGGPTRLTSPVLDLSGGLDYLIGYARWLYNDDGDDTLEVEVSNGGPWVLVESLGGGGGWTETSFRVADYVTPNATVQVRFTTADQPNDSVTEAGLDAFSVFAIECEEPGEVILPDDYTIVEGQHVSGDLSDLFESDDSRLVLTHSGFFPPWVELEVVGTATAATPSQLQFTFEGHPTAEQVEQRIKMYNYAIGDWEEVDVRIMPTTDEVIGIVISDDPSRFIDPGTLEMKTRIRWMGISFLNLYGWNAEIDQTIWTLTP